VRPLAGRIRSAPRLIGFRRAKGCRPLRIVRESLYSMIGALTELGVTVMLTVEVTDSFAELPLSPQGTSFLTDGYRGILTGVPVARTPRSRDPSPRAKRQAPKMRRG
jgi:hypothetical protein